jgi:hypothetical protein
MALHKISSTSRSPRHWALVAPALFGKSTFAAKMALPNAFMDMDHRISTVAHHAKDINAIYTIDIPPEKLNDIRAIGAEIADSIMESHRMRNPIKTVTVDSLTALIEPLVTGAMLSNAAKENTNQSAAFRDKALVMRYLQDAISRFGTDVLWIWHKEDGTFNGQASERQTLTETERKRLFRNLDAVLTGVIDKNGRRGLEVENLRPSRDQKVTTVLWDDSGTWEGMPERIDEFLRPVAQAKGVTPTAFASRDEALNAAIKKGVFADLAAAEKAYNELKATKKPSSAGEMFAAWAEHLEGMAQAAQKAA